MGHIGGDAIPIQIPGVPPMLSQDLEADCSDPETANQQVGRIRDALGAVAAGEPAVFWVYQDCQGNWCVRREGAPAEDVFPTQEEARSFVGVEAARCRAYRLFIARCDGRFTVELFNWPLASHPS